MPWWYWPNNQTLVVGTSPTWVTISTPTATSGTTNLWANQTTTTSNSYNTWSIVEDRAWLTQVQAQAQMQQQHAAALQAAQMQQAIYNGNYQQGLGSLGLGRQGLAAPAIIAHQEQARRDQEAYRRAVGEHDEQEASRILRLIEARERNEAQRQRLIDQQAQQALERQRTVAAAGDRARELLLEHLTPAQRETFLANGWFVVEGGRTKTKYRINNRGAAGNIDVMHADVPIARLCCHAQSHIPLGDQWLAQKIMLELAEDDFLRIANRTNFR